MNCSHIVPPDILEQYRRDKRARPTILFQWAKVRKSTILIKIFKCGKKQAAHAKHRVKWNSPLLKKARKVVNSRYRNSPFTKETVRKMVAAFYCSSDYCSFYSHLTTKKGGGS